MPIRPYAPEDRAACLALFDSNVPNFFAPHERAEFAAWLLDPSEYFVLEDGEGGSSPAGACGSTRRTEGVQRA